MVLNNKYTISNISLFAGAFVLLCLLSLVACKKDPKTSDLIPKIDSPKVTAPTIYVVGQEFKNSKLNAKLWINGSVSSITDTQILFSSAGANNVYVVGDDIYIAGFQRDDLYHQTAKFWKNGIPTALTDGKNNAYANSIYIDGRDIYVAGRESNGSKFIAKLWKNGIATNLTSGVEDATADGFYTFGSEIYVSGFNEKFQSCYWKDGVETVLPKGAKSVVAQSEFSDGINKYHSGTQRIGSQYIIKVWKNLEVIDTLIISNYGSYPAKTFVRGSDIYVVGEISNGSNTKAVIWKNGVETVLPEGTSATSIFVK
jgi:hypothetical protein